MRRALILRFFSLVTLGTTVLLRLSTWLKARSYGSPKQFDLYVNGKKKTTIVSTDTELDLTQYLVDTSSKLIPRGSWLSIEVRPNDLAYVSIDMFVQGFVQSRGDATV